MSDAAICDRHAWASAGVVVRDGAVCRIWECEDCPAWTAEELDDAHEQPWEGTWLAER
jgi:hypothetical protein